MRHSPVWGAYTSSLLALQYGISPWIGLIIGACVAALLGIVIGLPSIRLRGDYLALATFGFGVIVYSVAKNWVSLTRGPMGLPGIPGFNLFGLSLDSIFLIVSHSRGGLCVVHFLCHPEDRQLSIREGLTGNPGG